MAAIGRRGDDIDPVDLGRRALGRHRLRHRRLGRGIGGQRERGDQCQHDQRTDHCSIIPPALTDPIRGCRDCSRRRRRALRAPPAIRDRRSRAGCARVRGRDRPGRRLAARRVSGRSATCLAELDPGDRGIAEEAVDPLDDLGHDMLHHRRMRAATR